MKNGGNRGQSVERRQQFCQKTESVRCESPYGRDKKVARQTDRQSGERTDRKGLLAIQGEERERWGRIDRLNMTAGTLLWSQPSQLCRQAVVGGSDRIELSYALQPSIKMEFRKVRIYHACFVIPPSPKQTFSSPIVRSLKSVGAGAIWGKSRRHTHARWVVG